MGCWKTGTRVFFCFMALSANARANDDPFPCGYRFYDVGSDPNSRVGQYLDEDGDGTIEPSETDALHAIWSVFALLGTDAITAVPADGPVLYAAGTISWDADGDGTNNEPGIDFDRVAKWDGDEWTGLGFGLCGPVAVAVPCPGSPSPLPRAAHVAISAMAVYDDDLYVGGFFQCAGLKCATSLAKWDGSEWLAVGAADDDCPCESIAAYGPSTTGDYGIVEALIVYEAELYVGGAFNEIVQVQVGDGLARWNGTSWSGVGGGLDPNEFSLVFDFAVFDGDLYVGGDHQGVAGLSYDKGIIRWDGSSWSEVGRGLANGVVLCSAVFDDGTGEALYIGGRFSGVVNSGGGSVSVSNVAKWNGTSWSALGAGLDNDVHALFVFEEADGPALYAGGFFDGGIRRWNPGNGQWRLLGDGIFPGAVRALATYAEDGESKLFLGGNFAQAGRHSEAIGIAKWAKQEYERADCNCSGAVDSFDISAYSTALTNPSGYEAQYPNCDRMLADVDCDGDVDSFDTAPFVSCLTQGGCP